MFAEALARADASMTTGRMIVTFGDGAVDDGIRSLSERGMRIQDARDYIGTEMDQDADADAMIFAEIGIAVVSAPAAEERGMDAFEISEADGPPATIEPEHFVFADTHEYLRGFLRAAGVIASDIGLDTEDTGLEAGDAVAESDSTWGLRACDVPDSKYSGRGIKVAVLDTGFDLGHPDFAGRAITGASFVGQPVLDLHGHGTHCTGTACGPATPSSPVRRYGIAHNAEIYIGKVLTNSGFSVDGSVLAGMNWAIQNRCEVISMSLGGRGGPRRAYTSAGDAALRAGCLIIAAAGNENRPAGAPANSPTIMSVASLDRSLSKSSFSNYDKIEIAAPGRDVFSCWRRPMPHRTISGTSMATPHVAGCAALFAESSPSLRGQALWRRLEATAKTLHAPSRHVGAGLVQAP